jgi:ribosomal-protein-alanine N-acetyltransferase
MESKYPLGIREAAASDIDAISGIEEKCFPGPIAYSKRQLAYLILRANSTCLLESQGSVTRGFVIITYRQGSSTGHLETINVDPSFKKQGIGLKLLTAAEADMKQRCMKRSQLEVSRGNRAALALYKKSGYAFKERIERYYKYDHHGTRDAVRMVKTL